MATVGSANIDITADSSQANGVIGGFMGSLRKIGSIATGVVGGLAIFDTIKSTFGGLYESTIGANASMEQYQNTLTTVMGSSEKAAETLNWVKDFAASTPFEIPGLVEGATMLESYGLSAQEWLPAIGDMASVMGKDVNQGVEAIADAMTGEMERMKEFGITKDMVLAQAEELGLGMVANAKGQITNQEGFNEALMSLMKERFEGGMAIQSQSFNGLISNAKDSMSQLLTTMSQPLFEGMKAGLQEIVPIMSGFTAFMQGDAKKAMDGLTAAFGPEKAEQIMGTFTKIRDGVMAFVEDFKQFIADLQPSIDNLKRIFAAIAPVVGAAIAVLWNAISTVGPPILEFITGVAAAILEWDGFLPIVAGIVAGFLAFKTVITVMNLWKNAITAVKTAQLLLNASMLANPITWIIALIVGLIAMFVVLYNKNETFRTAVQTAWQAIKDAFSAVITWATETLPVWWQSVKDGFMDMVNGVVMWFQDMGARIMAFLQPFITFFVQSWENLKLLVLGIVEVFIGLVTGNFDKLKLGLLAIWTAIKSQALNYWNLLKNTVIQVVINLWNTVVNWFNNGKNNIINAVKSAKDNVVNGFRNAKDAVVSRVKEMWNAVRDWVGKIPGKFQEMKEKIISKVKSIDLWQLGKDIVQGLINGIGSMISAVGRKAREIAGKVESSIKSRLGISSPAKATIEIGYETGTGFIVGLNDQMANAMRAAGAFAGNVANAISDKTRNAMNNVWDGIFQFTRNDPLWKYFEAIREDGDWLNDWAAYLPEQMKSGVINLGKSISPMLEGLKNWSFEEFMQNYLNAILVDGDWLNDWLTYVPQNMRNQIRDFGKQFAEFEGLTQTQFAAQQKQTVEQHTHYWQVNADEITDVQSLINVVNGIVQTVRSR